MCCATCTPPRLSPAEAVSAGPEPGLGDPTFQTESTSLEPGPCKANKILGTFLPPFSCPVFSPRWFLSPIPVLVLHLRFWRSVGYTAAPSLWTLLNLSSIPWAGIEGAILERAPKGPCESFLPVNSTLWGSLRGDAWWVKPQLVARAPDGPGYKTVLPCLNDLFAPPHLPPLDSLRSHLVSSLATCKSC